MSRELNRSLKKIHTLINPKHGDPPNWIGALQILLGLWRRVNEQLEVTSPSEIEESEIGDEYFRATLGPLLAECFAPIHGYANRCALLGAWRQDREQTESLLEDFQQALSETRGLVDDDRLLTPLELRIAALQSLPNLQSGLGDQQPQSSRSKGLADSLGKVRRHLGVSDVTSVSDTGKHTSVAGWSILPHLCCDRPPAAVVELNRLPNTGTAVGLVNTLQSSIRDALELGSGDAIPWRDPAVAYVADLLVQLLESEVPVERTGHSDAPHNWLSGHSWILIAVDDPQKRSTNPTGMLLLLRIDVLKEGCGAFYPDPAMSGHLLMEQTFQNSFRNAWQVVLGNVNDGSRAREFDYRWSLTVMDDSWNSTDEPHRLRQLPFFFPLSGHSIELAVAAALKSAVEQIPLDRTRAATACFTERCITKLNSSPLLATVLSVDKKDIGLTETKTWKRSMRSVHSLGRIDTMIVAATQTAEGFLQNSPIECQQFDSAWNELSQASRWTEEFNRQQREASQKFFQQYCFADRNRSPGERLTDDDTTPLGSYILNDMQRMPDERDPAESHQMKTRDDGKKEIEPLKMTGDERHSERLAILKGRDTRDEERVPRYRLKADSGMGKTTLLERCAWQIASGQDGRIPILLTDLSSHLEFTGRDAFLAEIAADKLDWITDEDERLGWLKEKAKRGELVFLLDAIDQTSAHWGNLPAIVRKFKTCPFLVTLREEALNSRAMAWKSIQWDDVEMLPLSAESAKTYLSQHAVFYFPIMTEEQGNLDPGSVLTVPLILRLLKEFADKEVGRQAGFAYHLAGAFGRIQHFYQHHFPEHVNRYVIYNLVICGSNGLIGCGLETLTSQGEDKESLFDGRDDAIEKCCHIAYWHLKNVGFEHQLPQERRLKQEWSAFVVGLFQGGRPAVLRSILQQLNLITARSVFEDPKHLDQSITWRHRSFFEYLGGRRLAELFSSEAESERQEAAQTLKEIHQITKVTDLWEDWRWTLRFALCHAEEGEERDQLALELIRHGNPWVVYQAINGDGLQLGDNVAQLTDWLVHRYTLLTDDYVADTPPVESLVAWLRSNDGSLIDDMFSPKFRDEFEWTRYWN